MKWFKHDSNASHDAKLKKLIIRFGLEGYGLYFYCLEAVARSVEPHNLTFELEHDAEVIGHEVGLHPDRVEEIMKHIIEAGLFENDGGRITCLKLANRTDEYTQKLLKSRLTPDTLPTHSRQSPTKSVLIEQNRTDKNRKEKKPVANDGLFDLFWEAYPKKVDKKKARTAFNRLKKADKKKAINDAGKRFADTEKQFTPNPTTYIHGARWDDEIVEVRPAIKFPAKGDVNAWVAFAHEHGVKTKAGESMFDFERRVRDSVGGKS